MQCLNNGSYETKNTNQNRTINRCLFCSTNFKVIMRKAIAMKCTQEQFEAVKHHFNKTSIQKFEKQDYLTNFFCGTENYIANITMIIWGEEIHETWNEKVFLEACGIEADPIFTITKAQILELKSKINKEPVDYLIEKWFPKAFKKELEVGKWYKRLAFENTLVFAKEITKDGFKGYGFTFGDWEDAYTAQSALSEITEATTKEVEAALIAEAKKRGYKAGLRITPLFSNGTDYYPDTNTIASELKFHYDNEELSVDGECGEYRIFAAGKWTTIITTITKAEAEKRLGVKIE